MEYHVAPLWERKWIQLFFLIGYWKRRMRFSLGKFLELYSLNWYPAISTKILSIDNNRDNNEAYCLAVDRKSSFWSKGVFNSEIPSMLDSVPTRLSLWWTTVSLKLKKYKTCFYIWAIMMQQISIKFKNIGITIPGKWSFVHIKS